MTLVPVTTSRYRPYRALPQCPAGTAKLVAFVMLTDWLVETDASIDALILARIAASASIPTEALIDFVTVPE